MAIMTEIVFWLVKKSHNDVILDCFSVSEKYCSNDDCIIRNFDSMNNRTLDGLIICFERWLVYQFIQKMVQIIVVLSEMLMT